MVIFVIIEFALVIVPYAFLELRPESTKRQLKVAQGWITGHARQLIAIALIIAGTYMTVTGLIRPELIVLPSPPSLSRSQAATADGAGVTLAG